MTTTTSATSAGITILFVSWDLDDIRMIYLFKLNYFLDFSIKNTLSSDSTNGFVLPLFHYLEHLS